MVLVRESKNPIFKPKFEWEKRGVFNPSIFYDGEVIHMLYRGVDERGVSRIGYAYSKDGIHFNRLEKPILEPSTKFDAFGCEDPRLTYIEEEKLFYLTYVGIDNERFDAPKTALAKGRSFLALKKEGIISGAYNKDVIIFPKKIKEKYVVLHRPYHYIEKPSIRISFQSSLKKIEEGEELIKTKEEKVGSGFVVELEDYWLLIYHEVIGDFNKNNPRGIKYVGKAALLEKDNPKKVVGISPPILTPKEKYELEGIIHSVVFPSGGFIKNNMLHVYYGAADYCVGLARIEVDKLIKVIEGDKKE